MTSPWQVAIALVFQPTISPMPLSILDRAMGLFVLTGGQSLTLQMSISFKMWRTSGFTFQSFLDLAVSKIIKIPHTFYVIDFCPKERAKRHVP